MNPAYKLLQAVLWCLWPPSIWAASTMVTLEQTLTAVGPLSWFAVLILSTMGGLTSLLHRLKTDSPPNMMLYVVSHMLLAWFSGITAFFLLEAIEVQDLVELPMIGMCAYAGARLVDPLSDKISTWLQSKLEKIFG